MCVFCVGAQKPSNARALAFLYLPVLHHGKEGFPNDFLFVTGETECAMILVFGC